MLIAYEILNDDAYDKLAAVFAGPRGVFPQTLFTPIFLSLPTQIYRS